MYSFSAVLSAVLFASQTLAATIDTHPAYAVQWMGVPRTLQERDFPQREDLGTRNVGLSPLMDRSVFPRQSSCSGTQHSCPTGGCCPSGYTCGSYGSETTCCPTGETCSGPPVGCADANSVECPASVGGCCPIGQLCYRDSGGVARCDSSGLFSSSAIDTYAPPTTTHTTPIVTYTTTAFTPTTPTSTSRATVAGSNQPVIVTVKAGTRKSAQLGACMLALVSGAFFLLT